MYMARPARRAAGDGSAGQPKATCATPATVNGAAASTPARTGPGSQGDAAHSGSSDPAVATASPVDASGWVARTAQAPATMTTAAAKSTNDSHGVAELSPTSSGSYLASTREDATTVTTATVVATGAARASVARLGAAGPAVAPSTVVPPRMLPAPPRRVLGAVLSTWRP